MHEYSLALSLRDAVERRARAAGAARVARVVVRVGAAAGVEIDLLTTAWENVRRTALCSGAAIDVERVPERWVCSLCAAPLAPPPDRCDDCDVAARLDGGDELVLTRIDVVRDGPAAAREA